MSRLLYQAELHRRDRRPAGAGQRDRAPLRNRTVDLLLTMETLWRLSQGGGEARGSLHGLLTAPEVPRTAARGARVACPRWSTSVLGSPSPWCCSSRSPAPWRRTGSCACSAT